MGVALCGSPRTAPYVLPCAVGLPHGCCSVRQSQDCPCPMGVALCGSPRTALAPWVLLCAEVPGLPLPHGCCSVRKSQDCPICVALCGSPRTAPYVLPCAVGLPHGCCSVRQSQDCPCPMGVALYGSPRTALASWVLLCAEVPGLPLPHGCCSVRKSQDCPICVALCGSPRFVPWVLLCEAVPGLPLPHLLICATVPGLPHMCCPVRQPQSHQSSAWLWLIHHCHDKITR